VELGTGLANFEDIGPTMEIVFGPQGGWHLYVSCRIYNVTVDGALLTYRTERDGVLISMPNGYRLEPRRLVRARDHYLRVGDLAIFDITMPSDVVGDTVTVTVTIEPPDGDPVTDARTAMVVDEVP
jgi:hypothetical protein